jgi:predicted AAA+ superfamily ATPase
VAQRELTFLQEIAVELPARIAASLQERGWLGGELAWPLTGPRPSGSASSPTPLVLSDAARELAGARNWAEQLPTMLAIWASYGSGSLGRHDAFRWDGPAAELVPVLRPDPITLADLRGYERQRQTVLANTEQFVAGHSANNLLLYGDRGTGKSSLVKALRPAYGPKGLRLIEVAKEDLGDLPVLLPQLTGRRGRFILFIDDLSFGEGEDYRGLKAVLEGSLVARPDNVLVYATTNRRHLVHETRGERIAAGSDGEAAHAARLAQGGAAALNPRDVLQEKLSLADRFGQTIRFPAPDQQEYLDIVTHVARQRGLDMPATELHELALRWAQWHNGRSGRTARQFLDDLVGRLGREAAQNDEPGVRHSEPVA